MTECVVRAASSSQSKVLLPVLLLVLRGLWLFPQLLLLPARASVPRGAIVARTAAAVVAPAGVVRRRGGCDTRPGGSLRVAIRYGAARSRVLIDALWVTSLSDLVLTFDRVLSLLSAEPKLLLNRLCV